MGRKSSEVKGFLIAQRKKMGTGLTNAPVWVMQKAGKRIYNKRAKRHWTETNLRALHKKILRKQGKVEKKAKSGHHEKRGRAVKKQKAVTAKRPR